MATEPAPGPTAPLESIERRAAMTRGAAVARLRRARTRLRNSPHYRRRFDEAAGPEICALEISRVSVTVKATAQQLSVRMFVRATRDVVRIHASSARRANHRRWLHRRTSTPGGARCARRFEPRAADRRHRALLTATTFRRAWSALRCRTSRLHRRPHVGGQTESRSAHQDLSARIMGRRPISEHREEFEAGVDPRASSLEVAILGRAVDEAMRAESKSASMSTRSISTLSEVMARCRERMLETRTAVSGKIILSGIIDPRRGACCRTRTGRARLHLAHKQALPISATHP